MALILDRLFSAPRALAHIALAAGLLAAAPALAQDAPLLSDPNPVCGPDVSAGRFKLAEIGPQITGTWKGVAPGIGMTQGVQSFSVVISFERGRLYMSGNGSKLELKPVYGTRKALRYDPVRQEPLPASAHAIQISPEDAGLVENCEVGLAPQFTWATGSGTRRAAGFYSFLSSQVALGTMWNTAQGAREVYLSR